ncbi:hypothetical protein [Denitromonas sp.]|jgi:hypothetical protein|uniref:hypothetical protein n=1 Tax=Denitromonas sp. TaxID=2734609 RepID=UPI002AFF966F|nr:hypothetical protein [Denitromonas sp.]
MTRNNIVRFPGAGARLRGVMPDAGRGPANDEAGPGAGEMPGAVPRSAGGRAVTGALRALRYALFLLLMWVRGPLRFLLGLVGVPALIASPMVWLGYEGANKGELLLLCAGGGFGAFALAWFYDSLVLALAPEPIFLN